MVNSAMKSPQCDFKKLAPGKWLDSWVINDWMKLVMAQKRGVFVFGTMMMSRLLGSVNPPIKQDKERVIRELKVNLLDYDLVFAPVHTSGGTHWCLLIADMNHHTVTYNDSLGGSNQVNLLT